MTTEKSAVAPLSATELDKLEALMNAATAAPWSWWTSNSMLRLTGANGLDGGVLCPYYANGHADLECSPADQALITAMRNILPALIAQARAATVASVEDARDAARYRWLREKARYVDWGRQWTPSTFTTHCRITPDMMDREIDAAMQASKGATDGAVEGRP